MNSGRPVGKGSRVRFGKGNKEGEEEEETATVDELTKLRKLREAEAEVQEEEIECHDKVMNDRRCLVGVRRMELDMGDGRETRMKRLLDASPSAMGYEQYRQLLEPHPQYSREGEAINESRDHEPLTIDPPPLSLPTTHTGVIVEGRMWEAIGATIVLGFVTFWVLTRGETWRKALGIKASPPSQPTTSVSAPATPAQAQIAELKDEATGNGGIPENVPKREISSTSTSDNNNTHTLIPIPATPSTPSTAVPGSVPDTATPGNMSGPAGDETDKEDMEGTNTDAEDFVVVSGGAVSGTTAAALAPDATPKKKTRRGRRGAKKPKNGSTAENGDAGVKVNGKEKEKDQEGEDVNETQATQTPPSSLIVTSTVKPVATPSPSLTVSDTVLGKPPLPHRLTSTRT
jgi:serine/threonine-protein kinase/endoribonuclease IRE1